MAGASGHLLKQIRGTSLVDAIRQVAAGKSCWAVGHRTVLATLWEERHRTSGSHR
jgi:hypothetical protein